MYRGAFVIHRARLNLFMLLTLWLALVSAWQAMHPNAYDLAFSINSLLQFLLLNAFCVLSFAEELDEGRVLPLGGQYIGGRGACRDIAIRSANRRIALLRIHRIAAIPAAVRKRAIILSFRWASAAC